MDEHDDNREEEVRPARGAGSPQGVRIIPADQAAAALETGQAGGRRPEDEPRFGDVPPAPPEGPRPVQRFPLPDSVDPEAVPRPPVAGEADPEEAQAWARFAAGASAQPPGASAQPPGASAQPPGASAQWHGSAQWPDGEPLGEEPPGPEASGLGGADPSGMAPVGDVPAAGPVPAIDMPHWTEPPTGEVPRILPTSSMEAVARPAGLGQEGGQDDDDLSAWSELAQRGSAWRAHQTDWDDPAYEPALLGGDEVRLGALDESREDPEEQFSFASLDEGERRPIGGWEAAVEEEDPVVGVGGRSRRLLGAGARPIGWRRPGPAGARRGGAGPLGHEDGEPGLARGGGSSTLVRIGTGVLIGAVALILFAVGPIASLAMVTLLVTLAGAELYSVMRQAGYRPATLLGLVATICVAVAAFLKGESGMTVVTALTVVATLLWYLFGVERGRPTANLLATLGGFLWIGFLGAYAGLLLSPSLFPHRHGVAFVLGAAIATVAYDIGALAAGSRLGRRLLAPTISPRKTWEGLIGGVLACIVLTVLIVAQIHPWGYSGALALALVVCVVAPLGDLCESMIKRDIGVKDMGSILPGHGGVLDRIDAMLFVMPATFYLVRVLGIG